MSQNKRRTQYDRVLIVLEEMIPVWRNNAHKSSPKIADWLAENLANIGPGSDVLKQARKSEIAAGQLQFLREFLHPENRHGNEKDDALNKSREIFGREFPEFYAKLKATRERIIKRGKIRSEDEYYLIREYIDDIEGEPESSALLATLYELVDDFSVD